MGHAHGAVCDDLECEFCAIVNGRAHANVVASWQDELVFSPLHPATPGHLLVVPRCHRLDILDLTETENASMAQSVRIACREVKERLKPDGLNVITSAGEAATQSVFHLHIHIIPRYWNDLMGPIWPTTGADLPDVARALDALQRGDSWSENQR